MGSKIEPLALKAIRHFKEGQLSSWVGDAERASREFEKCKKAIYRIKKGASYNELDRVAEVADILSHRKDERLAQARKGELRATERQPIPIQFTILPLGSNTAEFRARIRRSAKYLSSITHEVFSNPGSTSRLNKRVLQWIEVNQQIGFIGTFVLTFSDGTLYAELTTPDFLEEAHFEPLGEAVAKMLVRKLRTY